MKKLSLLVALALLITVGGVYATWIYPSGAVSSADTMFTHKMATVEDDASVGTFAATDNSVVIVVDQANAQYQAELDITGSVTFTFTPAAGVDPEIAANGIDAEVQFYGRNISDKKYDGKEIYIVNGTPIPIYKANDTTDDVRKWELVNGVLRTTFTAADIGQYIEINPDITLPTHDAYNDFHELEESITLNILIREKPVLTP